MNQKSKKYKKYSPSAQPMNERICNLISTLFLFLFLYFCIIFIVYFLFLFLSLFSDFLIFIF